MKINWHTQERDYAVSRIRKSKKKFHANLNVKDITDNRKFWKTVKALFSDKPKSRNVTLIENKNTEVNITKIADSLNNYFSNVVTSLKIPDFKNIDNLLERISGISKATLMSVVKYLKHPSIKAINKAFPNKYFSFSTIKLIVCPINKRMVYYDKLYYDKKDSANTAVRNC